MDPDVINNLSDLGYLLLISVILCLFFFRA